MSRKHEGHEAALFHGSKVPTLQSVQNAGAITALAIVCQIALEAKSAGESDAIFSFPPNRGDVCNESDAEAAARAKGERRIQSDAVCTRCGVVVEADARLESDSDTPIQGTTADEELMAGMEEEMDDVQEECDGVVEKN